MSSNAVAGALTSESRSVEPAEAGATQPLDSLARQLRGGRRLGPGRSYLGLVVLVVVAIWVVFMFGRALTQLNEATQRAAAVRTETGVLYDRLEEVQRELELVQTDAFLSLQARGYGMGESGERVFGLAPGAPAPPAIVPLGGTATSADGRTPLESWLRLLFGGD
jgi:hypothetical protein